MNEVTNPRLDEMPAAFRLLFSHLTSSEQESRLESALNMLEEGNLDPDGVFVVRDRSGWRGAIVAVPLSGCGGVVWAPTVTNGPQRDALADQLAQAALTWLRARGAKLAHALMYVEETSRALPLVRNGFSYITRLQYLQLTLSDCPISAASDLYARTYAEVPAALFHQTLERTYEGSLDCPELNGIRTIDEIIEGHQGQGDHDPRRWWLAYAPEPCAVMLLTHMPAWNCWDISYIGVVPEARRRGIGRRLLQLAIAQAHSAGVPELTVAVDMRNEPACKLYAQLGFQSAEQRDVYLAVF